MPSRNTTTETAGSNRSAKLLGHRIRLVSFDVFDTALLRQLVEPSDIHRLTANRLGLTDAKEIDQYVQLRCLAETTARSLATDAGRHEIGIAEIRVELGKLLPPELAAKDPIPTEIRLEQQLAKRNPRIFDLFKKARKKGLSVAFTADTCLPHGLVAKMLHSAGYNWDYIFLSSQTGRTKQDGSLFSSIVERTPFEANQILHVGDEQDSDVQQPKSANLRADLASAPRVSAVTPNELGVDRTGVDSIALSLAADHQAKVADSLTPSDVGYYSIGPLLTGFAAWVSARVAAESPDHILLTPQLQFARRLFEMVDHEVGSRVRPSTSLWRPDGAINGLALESFLSTHNVEPGQKFLVVDLGWDDHNVAQVQKRLPESLEIKVSGLCLGLFDEPLTSTTAWAFSTKHNTLLAERMRQSDLVHVLASQNHQTTLAKPQVANLLQQLYAGALAFTEDIQPWIGYGKTTGALCWPALRTLESPTFAEAKRLASATKTRVASSSIPANGDYSVGNKLVRSLHTRTTSASDEQLKNVWSRGSEVLRARKSANRVPQDRTKRLALRNLRLGQRGTGTEGPPKPTDYPR